MATNQHTPDNLALHLLRAALIVEGELSVKLPLPPEPPMDLRQIIGRAMHMCELISGLCEEGVGFEEWEQTNGGEVDELLAALVLVVTPASASPN